MQKRCPPGPGFRRRGYLARIVAAVVAAALVRILGVAAKSAVSGEATLWPFMYGPPLIGIALALLVLWRGVPNFAKPASEARA